MTINLLLIRFDKTTLETDVTQIIANISTVNTIADHVQLMQHHQVMVCDNKFFQSTTKAQKKDPGLELLYVA